MSRKLAHGGSSTVSASSVIEAHGLKRPLSPSARTALLLGAGALATLLHQWLRVPLHLPGHHGLEWLAILMLARLSTRAPAAGLRVGIGAAASLVVMSGAIGIDGHGAQMLTYVLQGALLDALYTPRLTLPLPLRCFAIGAIGAAVLATAPLLKNLLASFGSEFDFGSLAGGLGYPLLTHALFGAAGALTGLALHAATRRMQRQR